MSVSLVRKGLELCGYEPDSETSRGTGLGKRKSGPSSMRREDLLKEIGTQRKGVKKQLKRMKHKEARKPTAKEGNIKSSIESYLKSKPADCLEDNVQLLLGLSKSDPSTSKNYGKILKHSRGRLAKDNIEVEQAPKGSAFSEEDFELFEKEYMPKKRETVLL